MLKKLKFRIMLVLLKKVFFVAGFTSRYRRPQHDERLLHLPRLHLQEVGLGGHQEKAPQPGEAHLLANYFSHEKKVRKPGFDAR